MNARNNTKSKRIKGHKCIPYKLVDDNGVPVLYLISTMPFGKYKGFTLNFVMNNDVEYFEWFKTVYNGEINLIKDELINRVLVHSPLL